MREEGYYFVKYKGIWKIDEWIHIGKTLYTWDTIHYPHLCTTDSAFDEIGDKIELPNN